MTYIAERTTWTEGKTRKTTKEYKTYTEAVSYAKRYSHNLGKATFTTVEVKTSDDKLRVLYSIDSNGFESEYKKVEEPKKETEKQELNNNTQKYSREPSNKKQEDKVIYQATIYREEPNAKNVKFIINLWDTLEEAKAYISQHKNDNNFAGAQIEIITDKDKDGYELQRIYNLHEVPGPCGPVWVEDITPGKIESMTNAKIDSLFKKLHFFEIDKLNDFMFANKKFYYRVQDVNKACKTHTEARVIAKKIANKRKENYKIFKVIPYEKNIVKKYKIIDEVRPKKSKAV